MISIQNSVDGEGKEERERDFRWNFNQKLVSIKKWDAYEKRKKNKNEDMKYGKRRVKNCDWQKERLEDVCPNDPNGKNFETNVGFLLNTSNRSEGVKIDGEK